MENLILFKLYRNVGMSEFHDLSLGKYESCIKTLREDLMLDGRQLYFMILQGGNIVDGTPFAEVEYTGELSETQKGKLLYAMELLCSDGELSSKGELVEIRTLALVRFKKIRMNEEIVFIRK